MDIPEFGIIMQQISELKSMVETKKSSKQYEERFAAEWYNDEKCWELKGGMSLSTYRSNRYYQCKGGIPDAKVGGRNVWYRDSVMEWVRIPDSDLPAYHAKYKTGATKR